MNRTEENRIVVCAPFGRDGELACRLVVELGHPCQQVPHPGALAQALAPLPAVLVLTEEALAQVALRAIRDALGSQAAWSDLPIVLFMSAGYPPDLLVRYTRVLGSTANVTVLERPIRPPTLASVVEAAMRARRRQYELRDLLARLRTLNASLEARVDERTTQVRTLATALTLAEQRERERIAQVLHDDLQQLLFGLHISLGSLEESASDDEGLLARSNEILQQAIEVTRTLAIELHPPALDGEGLPETLTWIGSHMQKRYGLHTDLDIEPPLPEIAGELLVLLTRSVRELLFNVVKHAGVDHARLRVFSRAETLHLVVEDGGVGIEPAQGTGLGLGSLQRRLRLLGGRFDIGPGADGGTRAEIVVPTPHA